MVGETKPLHAFSGKVGFERNGDITSVDHCGTYTIQEPGANAGENPAANLNDLVGSSSNFEDIPAILSSVL